MAQYMLLLYDNPTDWQKLGPADVQKALEKYVAWVKRPFVVDAKRLTDDAGKVLKAQAGKAKATDGPYAETKEILGGYYTIEAASYDEAAKLASDHPHLEYGGAIVIRQIWPT
jgi:hypothetical protein